jgi:hypothetical protein
MAFIRRQVFVAAEVVAIALLSSTSAISQSQQAEITPQQDSRSKVGESRVCGRHSFEKAASWGESAVDLLYSLSDRFEDARNCARFSETNTAANPSPAPVLTAGMVRPDKPSVAIGLAPKPTLRDIGEEGTNISRAREAVLALLQDNNACSAWLRQSDPQIDTTFLSLAIEVDEQGSNHVIMEPNHRGIALEHGPYIARTMQLGGPGSGITINANGAFFRAKGDVYKLPWQGAVEMDLAQWRHLHIGPFGGGTLPAQVIALLHELAHVVGAIPPDDVSQPGLEISQKNTELVLQRCKAFAARAGKPNPGKILAKSMN